MTHELEIEARIGREDRGCNGTEGVVADPEYGTLVEYSVHIVCFLLGVY